MACHVPQHSVTSLPTTKVKCPHPVKDLVEWIFGLVKLKASSYDIKL